MIKLVILIGFAIWYVSGVHSYMERALADVFSIQNSYSQAILSANEAIATSTLGEYDTTGTNTTITK